MQAAPAEVVRVVRRGESISELVNEAKARAWETKAEHAVLQLVTRQHLIVKGGRDGIDFLVDGAGDERTLHVLVDGWKIRVTRIFGHTHPRVTGPSDGDHAALAILKQRHSYVFEIGGDPHGTRFGPKPSR